MFRNKLQKELFSFNSNIIEELIELRKKWYSIRIVFDNNKNNYTILSNKEEIFELLEIAYNKIIEKYNKKESKKKKNRTFWIISIFFHYIILEYLIVLSEKKDKTYKNVNYFYNKIRDNILKKLDYPENNFLLEEELLDIFITYQYNTWFLNKYFIETTDKTVMEKIKNNRIINNNNFNIFVTEIDTYLEQDFNPIITEVFDIIRKNKNIIITNKLKKQLKKLPKKAKQTFYNRIRDEKYLYSYNQIFILLPNYILEQILSNVLNVVKNENTTFKIISNKDKDLFYKDIISQIIMVFNK